MGIIFIKMNRPIMKTIDKDRLVRIRHIYVYLTNQLLLWSQLCKTCNSTSPSFQSRALLVLVEERICKSSIPAHLVDTGRQVDLNKAFKIIYNIPSNLPHDLWVCLLHIAEAIGIHVQKPNIYIRKKFL